MTVTVLTKSKWRTCESSGAQEDLAADRSRTAMTHVEWREMCMEYATRGRFYGFGPQNTGGGSEEERAARGGIEEFASRRSYLMKGAVAVE